MASAENRPKPDLDVDAHVTIWDVHGEVYRGRLEVRGLYLRGHLYNTTDEVAAPAAWRATRRSWEAGEGFLFGPVDEQGLDPRLDTWPVNKTDLDNILASSADLTDPAVIALLDKKLDATTFYVQTLAVPAPRDADDDDVAHGKELFR